MSTKFTPQDCINDLIKISENNPNSIISRDRYRELSQIPERVWIKHFGTFLEFKRQAGLLPTRYETSYNNQIAKHASHTVYDRFNIEKQQLGNVYTRDSKNKYGVVLACSDLHDIEIDKFYLRVLIDTAARIQPDVICFTGDIFDLPEFSKYDTDPRLWDAVGRIKFVHENIFKPLREVCPNAQIDLIEGNHEHRLLKHMAQTSPALKSILSDLHGLSISDLLGLKTYEINYIAPADLKAWNRGDTKKELQRNYKIYFNTLLACHYPDAKSLGMPGWNGHHHKHIVWSEFNPKYGSYEWHQLGGGHIRKSHYCDGEKWSNGFLIATCNKETGSTNFDYIQTNDFAISAGKIYERTDKERVK